MSRGWRKTLGDAGEDLAARWYRSHGYRVVDRNWHGPDGELDLVACLGRQIVFVEVKTRSSLAYGHPLEAVDATKQQRIRRTAAAWLRSGDARPVSMRFDVVAIVGGRLEVIEGAF